MAIKVSENKWKMTFGERIYVVPILQGMMVTLKHLFMKKATIRYPEQKAEISPRWRGRHVLKRNELGQERCVGCQMCELACPADAIYIEAAEVPAERRDQHPTERYAKVYNIDMLRCIFCGMCEEACPEAAIYLTPFYEFVADERSELVYNKEMLTETTGGPILFKE